MSRFFAVNLKHELGSPACPSPESHLQTKRSDWSGCVPDSRGGGSLLSVRRRRRRHSCNGPTVVEQPVIALTVNHYHHCCCMMGLPFMTSALRVPSKVDIISNLSKGVWVNLRTRGGGGQKIRKFCRRHIWKPLDGPRSPENNFTVLCRKTVCQQLPARQQPLTPFFFST